MSTEEINQAPAVEEVAPIVVAPTPQEQEAVTEATAVPPTRDESAPDTASSPAAEAESKPSTRTNEPTVSAESDTPATAEAEAASKDEAEAASKDEREASPSATSPAAKADAPAGEQQQATVSPAPNDNAVDNVITSDGENSNAQAMTSTSSSIAPTDHHGGGSHVHNPDVETFQNLFITKLHRNIKDQDLLGLFAPFGGKSATVMLDAKTGRSKGFGFVLFDTEAEGKRAHEAMHQKQITVAGCTAQLSIFPSKHDAKNAIDPSPSLYVRNVPINATKEEVERMLEQFGSVAFCAMREEPDGLPVWVILVEYDCQMCADNALSHLRHNTSLYPHGPLPVIAKYAKAMDRKRSLTSRKRQNASKNCPFRTARYGASGSTSGTGGPLAGNSYASSFEGSYGNSMASESMGSMWAAQMSMSQHQHGMGGQMAGYVAAAPNGMMMAGGSGSNFFAGAGGAVDASNPLAMAPAAMGGMLFNSQGGPSMMMNGQPAMMGNVGAVMDASGTNAAGTASGTPSGVVSPTNVTSPTGGQQQVMMVPMQQQFMQQGNMMGQPMMVPANGMMMNNGGGMVMMNRPQGGAMMMNGQPAMMATSNGMVPVGMMMQPNQQGSTMFVYQQGTPMAMQQGGGNMMMGNGGNMMMMNGQPGGAPMMMAGGYVPMQQGNMMMPQQGGGQMPMGNQFGFAPSQNGMQPHQQQGF